MEWQPIETAPKDGTAILAARWNKLAGGWEYSVVKWTGDTWAVIPTRDFRLSFLGTHWTSLPAPPETK